MNVNRRRGKVNYGTFVTIISVDKSKLTTMEMGFDNETTFQTGTSCIR